MVIRTIKTPCVGICSTGIGDDVCRGCKRFEHEVVNWNAYSEEQKSIVESRLVGLLTQVIQNKIRIVDEALMKQQIVMQPVDVPKHRNLYCQAYTLIKAGASQIAEPEMFGFQINNEFSTQSLVAICEDIDKEFYTLSSAHFDRSFRKTA